MLRRPIRALLAGRRASLLCVEATKLVLPSSLSDPNWPASANHARYRQARAASTRRTYLRSTALNVPDIERILSNESLTNALLHSLHLSQPSLQEEKSIHQLFLQALEMASGPLAQQAYEFVLDAWHAVFFRNQNSSLQEKFGQCKDRIVHLMLNQGDYAAYQKLMAPLQQGSGGKSKSWACTIMETLQPSRSSTGLVCNASSMRAFYSASQYSQLQKHKMNKIFITKTLLSGSSPEELESAMTGFLEYYPLIEGTTFSPDSGNIRYYRKCLRLLAAKSDSFTDEPFMEAIADICMSKDNDSSVLSMFVSVLLEASAHFYPQVAIQCWNYKNDNLENFGFIDNFYRTKEDLRNTMIAYTRLRAYGTALSLYAATPTLQDDLHISLLLKISEDTKDWELLQKQFEDMYGRHDLPHIIHYSIVMGALASIGATSDVEQLYRQLLKRNLTPTASIFRSLVMTNVNSGNVESVNKWFNEFLQYVDRGIIPSHNVAPLQLEVFQANLPSYSVESAMAALDSLIEKQKSSSLIFIDSSTICKMIRFVSATYSIEQFERIWLLAEDLGLTTDIVYHDAMVFLTKMGEFQRVNEMAFEAQEQADVPFQNSLILSAQLRNYRSWFKEITDSSTRKEISVRIGHIISRVQHRESSPRHFDHLLTEAIRHLISIEKHEDARKLLDLASSLNLSNESHFIPFLKEYSADGSYNDNSEVLKIYREMVSRKVSISARSYYYVAQSLISMDSINKKGFQNSYNLVQSVLELYGFSVSGVKSSSKVSLDELSKNALFLLKIVSDYAIHASSDDDSTMDLILDFLNQIRSKLEGKIAFSLRVSLLFEMSKVYLAYGDFQVANSLTTSAISELNDVIGHLHGVNPLPKLLQLDYRRVMDTKLSLLQRNSANVSGYVEIAQNLLKNNVRLSGYQLHMIGHKILSDQSASMSTVETVLDLCERFLVSGNWIEVKITRRLHQLYRILLVYLSRTMSVEAIQSKYDLFNQYYNVWDVEKLLADYEHIREPRRELEKVLAEYLALCPNESWTVENIFKRFVEFFVPERSISTNNIIKPNLASKLVTKIEGLCDGNKYIAFGLYDKFPETMEYLLYFSEERTRVVRFRMGVSEKSGLAATVTAESRDSRRQKTIEVLRSVGLN